MKLLNNPKEPKTFFSSRWQTYTNYDLAFNRSEPPNPAPTRRTLEVFPLVPHRPSLITFQGLQINMPSKPAPRWNFKKTHWKNFTQLTKQKADSLLYPINSDLNKCYEAFCSVILSPAKVYVPRSSRKIYTPCWDQQSQVLLEQLQDEPEASQQIIAEKLIHHLDELRRNRWEEAVNNIDFTHSSHKAWFFFNRLTEKAKAHHAVPISPNEIASRLVNCGKYPNPVKVYSFQVRKAIKDINQPPTPVAELCNPITVGKCKIALLKLKTGKASGSDNINPEFLKNLRLTMLNWIFSFFSECLCPCHLPKNLA